MIYGKNAYMSSINQKTKENIIAYGLVIVGAIVYISLIFNNNVWLDEAFSASLVNTDMASVLEKSMADTLPPLYNIFLKLFTDIFGYYVPVMKLASVIPMIITMLASATVVRRRHGLKVSSLFTIALFTMPNLLFFGVEIRMYSLGFMFATLSGIYAFEFIKDYNKKNLIVFTIVSVLSGYSHHFAFVSVGFVYLILLLYYFVLERENIKRWFICIGLTFVLYFPCLLVTLKQFKSVSGYFSMPDVTLSVFIKYMRYPYTVGNTVASILLLVSVVGLFIYGVFKAIRSYKASLVTIDNSAKMSSDKTSSLLLDENLYALSMFLVYYGVLIFGTIISKIMTANIFVDRYLFFAHGLIWLFFAIEAADFKKLYYGFMAIALLAGICGYINEVSIEYSTSPDEMVAFLENNTKPGDVLYTIENDEEMAFCLPFYEDNLVNYEELSEAVKASKANDSDIWLTVIDYSDYDFKELDEYGLHATDPKEFTFDRYNFTLYKLAQ